MGMRAITAERINKFKNEINNQPFKESDLITYNVSIQTLFKYGLIEHTEKITEISLDELITEINEMMGYDCCDMTGYYTREDDKIYYHEVDYYKFK